jgi:hypothetical protein
MVQKSFDLDPWLTEYYKLLNEAKKKKLNYDASAKDTRHQ